MTFDGFLWGAIFVTFWVTVGVGVLGFLFSPRRSESAKDARAIRDERYARGEISETKYKPKRVQIEG